MSDRRPVVTRLRHWLPVDGEALKWPLLSVAFVAGVIASVLAFLLVRDMRIVIVVGITAGGLILGMDPRLWLGLSAATLVAVATLLALGWRVTAESLARAAFFQIAVGVLLELRTELVKAVHRGPPQRRFGESRPAVGGQLRFDSAPRTSRD